MVVESTCPFQYQVEEAAPGQIILTAQGARANMYCNTIEVYDGLIEWIKAEEEPRGVVFHISLNHPASWQISCEPGIPTRTVLNFTREYLSQVFSSKIIVLDPGHGGNDPGGYGPVDLLEKNVTVSMAAELKSLLEPLQVQTHLTRNGDRALSQWMRCNLALKVGADLFISFHTHYNQDAAVEGLAVKYNPAAPESTRLAQFTLEELARKIKRPSRGIQADHQLHHLGRIPGITVEPVTISSWVEKGLLRNPTLYKKIAQGIFNWLRRYWSEKKE